MSNDRSDIPLTTRFLEAPEMSMKSGYLSPGARKEKVRQRRYDRSARTGRRHRHAGGYVELHTASAFSFLEGASLPEDLVARAAELELPAVALIDRDGVYGAPRFHKAAREAGIKALVGSEITLEWPMTAGTSPPRSPTCSSRTVSPPPDLPRLTLLVGSRRGYRSLCRLLTAAARGRPKGEARTGWALFEEHAAGLHCLTGGPEGPLARTLEQAGPAAADRLLDRLTGVFGAGRLHVEIQRHQRRCEERRNRVLVDLAERRRLPLLVTNGVRYARPDDKRLHDILTAIRRHTPLDTAGRLLAAHRERHFKDATQMAALFNDLPQALTAGLELAERLDFTLADLGYRFPDYPLPPGETPASYLRQITWESARSRFRPLTARAQTQLEKELAMIEKLGLAGYFLIVWDIVRFCQRESILAQGRGSAANSAVCYALSITAVDPVKMELLFERFLSEERGEWPDIDLDLPSGAQREKVIQYVYRRYGPHGAAMTANVITYRGRSAAREVAKALGYSSEQVDRLAKRLGTFGYDTSRGDKRSLSDDLAAAGFDPDEPRMRLFTEMWRKIQNLPRHLGQHSGGMVLAAGRLDEVVPLEPAAMADRVVVQWDKDDCADMGIIKVDLLGLGMLQALEEAIPTIRTHEGIDLDLAHLPADDPTVFRMLRAADTVGVFQVESRAQMASLPRNNPTCFYDLVIQVAIIRPGPIVGGMVNPYFERRRGRQPVVYPHPDLEPILKRTLGIPLFQEQLLRIAMVAAGFSGGEAEELRRAMGFKRSAERMESIERRLRAGMSERGLTGSQQDETVKAITSFALYGFPESHAASFALIAYASAYLKAHHPTAFLIALLNAWPMGFYNPASLVKDAQRHGVVVLPIDVNASERPCRWEVRPVTDGRGGADGQAAGGRQRANDQRAGTQRGAVRLGLRFVKGLRRESGKAIADERRQGPFRTVEELAQRCRLRRDELDTLARCGALSSLGLTRRAALWQAALVARPAGPLLAPPSRRPPTTTRNPTRTQPSPLWQKSTAPKSTSPGASNPDPTGTGQSPSSSPDSVPSSPLPEMTPMEETLEDYAVAGITTGLHPIEHLRPQLDAWRVVRAADLVRHTDGDRLRTAGAVTVRQRPGTAKGMLFITLEDGSGMSQAIVTPDLLQKNRQVIVGAAGLIVEGTLQKRDGTLSLKAERFWPLSDLARAPSHDFR